MSKIWIQREDGTGWWTAYGRLKGWPKEPWFRLSDAALTLTFFGLFGVRIDWNLGPYVSVGAAHVGYAGLGYVTRRRYNGPTSKDWARHDKLRSRVLE